MAQGHHYQLQLIGGEHDNPDGGLPKIRIATGEHGQPDPFAGLFAAGVRQFYRHPPGPHRQRLCARKKTGSRV